MQEWIFFFLCFGKFWDLCWVRLKFLVTIKGLWERGGIVKVFAIKVSVLLFVAVEILKRETVKKASLLKFPILRSC